MEAGSVIPLVLPQQNRTEPVLTGIMAPTQRGVAILYADAILRERYPVSALKVDWTAVNNAIIERWSVAGLANVKRLAWKEINQ